MAEHHYDIIIGLEIHAQLATKRKMFCSCKNETDMTDPNTNVCPVCMGHPGTLPVPNRKAIAWTIQTGLACGCTIASVSKFDRKHYFYPDLPKGYQISQYDQPFCANGAMNVDGKDIAIVRIHLEEDTGKLLHAEGASYIDYNRAGAPLMELVTAPTIENAGQAANFCRQYQLLLRTLGMSEANMERGEMRCEANVSVQEEGSYEFTSTSLAPKPGATLNAKVEIKNLNSFKAVEKAIQFEVMRQIELLEDGQPIVQETRGWDDAAQMTKSQRLKESAHDYRYFPEPDIPPLTFSEEDVAKLRRAIPEMPNEKLQRFMRQYHLSEDDSRAMTQDRHVAEFFENVMTEAGEWVQANKPTSEDVAPKESKSIAKLACNWILTELFSLLKERETDMKSVKISNENFAELMVMLRDGKVNSSAGRAILLVMFDTGGDPSEIAERKNLLQESDASAMDAVVDAVIANNAKAVEDYRAGNDRSMKFLMGQVMKESKGKANPTMAQELIIAKLKREQT